MESYSLLVSRLCHTIVIIGMVKWHLYIILNLLISIHIICNNHLFTLFKTCHYNIQIFLTKLIKLVWLLSAITILGSSNVFVKVILSILHKSAYDEKDQSTYVLPNTKFISWILNYILSFQSFY